MSKGRQLTKLTVVERLRVEIDAHKLMNRGEPLTVAALCRNAKVSRSTLYESHPKILEEIRAQYSVRKKVTPVPKTLTAARRDKDLQNKYQALLLLCLEMQKEIMLLRARLSDKESSSRAERNKRT